jgi:perosamine synthetase
VYNTEDVLNELRAVFDSGWTGLGKKTEEFEQSIAQFVMARYCLALNSCTSALHLAIRSLDLMPGSKIITTPLTFVSTNHVMLYEKLIPVFCDIEKNTGNIDIDMAQEEIHRNKISAIVVVHFGGYPCNMDKLNTIPISIIEDCAHAFGSEYGGIRIGSFGNICCWSFQAVKNLSIGDGGAITTDDKSDYERLKCMRWMGINKSTIDRSAGGYSWEYAIDELGYKYHMNDITATIGLSGLKTIEQQNMRRRAIAHYYMTHLKAELPVYDRQRVSSYHFLPVFVKNRDDMVIKLKERGISCGMHYKLNCDYPMYKDFKRINNCVNARYFSDHEVTLPINAYISDSDVEKIVAEFNDIIDRNY